MEAGIYQIQNHTRCQLYVGSAVNLGRRLKQHQKALATGSHSNRILRQWSQSDDIQFEIIHRFHPELTDRQYLLTLEESYIRGSYDGWQLVNLALPVRSTDCHSLATLRQHLATGYPIYLLTHESLEISHQMPLEPSAFTFLCLPRVRAFIAQNNGYLHLCLKSC